MIIVCGGVLCELFGIWEVVLYLGKVGMVGDLIYYLDGLIVCIMSGLGLVDGFDFVLLVFVGSEFDNGDMIIDSFE